MDVVVSPCPKYSYSISASCDRGDRDTMEDRICVYRGFAKNGALDFILLGLFDGHAGESAAQRAKEILPSKVDRLIRRGWSEEKALRQAFHDTNEQMLGEMSTWASSGSIPSRSGTTACVVLLRRGRLWTANCGDSTCILGIRVGEGRSWYPAGIRATSPHSLNARERARVARDGGQVAMDSRGNARVVFSWCDRHCWARQSRCTHKKSHYPCLNIARSLGDFWSFSSETGRYAVSCDPDIRCFSLADDNIFACCLHSDGVALSPAHIMKTVHAFNFDDKENLFTENSHNYAMDVIVQNRHFLRSRQYRDNAAAIVRAYELTALREKHEIDGSFYHCESRLERAVLRSALKVMGDIEAKKLQSDKHMHPELHMPAPFRLCRDVDGSISGASMCEGTSGTTLERRRLTGIYGRYHRLRI